MQNDDLDLSGASDEDFTNLDTSSDSSDDDIDDSSDNDSDDSPDEDAKKKKKNPKKPVKKPKKAPKVRIIFNVSDTQYDVVKFVGKKIFKWKLSYDKESVDWDMFWTDWAVEPETLARMQTYQKINHFPGMYALARKNHLGRNLMRMKKSFPEQYKFFPQTFLLPTEYGEFRNQFTGKKSNKTFIVKPEASCQGRGIFLTKTPDSVQMGEHYVVQRYLQKPFLIDGLKFDMRIYVLLAGCDPLKVFLYDDGLGRFATENYVAPTEDNLDNVCMHLTNYAINKDNPNFVFNESSSADDVGHKRSLKAVMRTLREMGHDVDKLWKEIKKIIIKTFCSVQPILSHTYRSCHPDEPYNNMCFELLGFDVMIDHKLKPWLIEVNHTPSFTTDTPLDKSIKKSAIRDALRIMNISVENKVKAKNKKRIELQQRVLTGKKIKMTAEEKKEAFEKAQQERDAWEAKNCGRYEKIYPFDDPSECDEDYEEYMRVANKWWEEWTGLSIKRNTKRVADPNKPPPMVFGSGTAVIPPKLKEMPPRPKLPTTIKPNSGSNSIFNQSTAQDTNAGSNPGSDNRLEKPDAVEIGDEAYGVDKELDDENKNFMAHLAAVRDEACDVIAEDQEEEVDRIVELVQEKKLSPAKSYTMLLAGEKQDKIEGDDTLRIMTYNHSPSMNAIGSTPDSKMSGKNNSFRIKTVYPPIKESPVQMTQKQPTDTIVTDEEQKVPFSKKLSSYLNVEKVDDLQIAVGAVPQGRDREMHLKKVPLKLSSGILGDGRIGGIHHIWTGPGSLAEMYSHEYEKDPKGASNLLLNKLSSGRHEYSVKTHGIHAKKVVSPQYQITKQPGNYLAPKVFEMNVGIRQRDEPVSRSVGSNTGPGISMQGFGIGGIGIGNRGPPPRGKAFQRESTQSINFFQDGNNQAAALQRYYNYLNHHQKKM